MTRVYAAIDHRDLDAWDAGDRRELMAVAVTPDVEALLPEGDTEEHEHVATQLAAATATAEQVVVAACDVRPERVTEQKSPVPGAVSVEGGFGLRDVVCFLAADPGERVSDDADLELSWYDVSERAAVRALFG